MSSISPAHAFRLRLRQVDLVEHRQHFQALLDGRVAVGYRLGFHTLSRVDDQQRALAGRQRAGHFVAEIDMSGRIDEIQLVGCPARVGIVERDASAP